MKKIFWCSLLAISFSCKNTSEENTSAVVEPPQQQQQTQQQYPPELKESISRGADIYSDFCASCHLAGGEGIDNVFPPLKNSDWLKNKQKESIHALKYGLNGPITVNGVEYDNLMPELGLTDKEVADVMNYINNSWGNEYGEPVKEEDVAAIEK